MTLSISSDSTATNFSCKNRPQLTKTQPYFACKHPQLTLWFKKYGFRSRSGIKKKPWCESWNILKFIFKKSQTQPNPTGHNLATFKIMFVISRKNFLCLSWNVSKLLWSLLLVVVENMHRYTHEFNSASSDWLLNINWATTECQPGMIIPNFAKTGIYYSLIKSLEEEGNYILFLSSLILSHCMTRAPIMTLLSLCLPFGTSFSSKLDCSHFAGLLEGP